MSKVKIPDEDEIFKKYKIKLKARDKFCGYMSPDVKQVKKLLQARKIDEDKIDELAEKIVKGMDISDEVEEEEISKILTFERDESGNCLVRERHIKGLIKEVSRMLHLTKRRGFKGFINHAISVKPESIVITKGGEPVKEVDGRFRRTGM